VESNLIVGFLRDFVRVWQRDGSIKRLRVFFPARTCARSLRAFTHPADAPCCACCAPQDKIELGLAIGGAARSSDGVPAPANTFTPGVFASFPGRTTWLTEPGFLTVSGLSKVLGVHPAASARTAPDDAAFVIAYPSLNLDEMSEVAALHAEVAEPRKVPIVTVNAELERIRSGYYVRCRVLPCGKTLTYAIHFARSRFSGRAARWTCCAPSRRASHRSTSSTTSKGKCRASCFGRTRARTKCYCAGRAASSFACTPATRSRACAPWPRTSSRRRWPPRGADDAFVPMHI
jgi:hypothetical protein